jgi:hypothetical protein
MEKHSLPVNISDEGVSTTVRQKHKVSVEAETFLSNNAKRRFGWIMRPQQRRLLSMRNDFVFFLKMAFKRAKPCRSRSIFFRER